MKSILKYRCLGACSNSPIVFLHGFLGTKEDWLEIAHSFSSTHHCILIDLPGHGESEISDELSFSHVHRQIQNTFEDLQIKTASLIGYSLGGRLAMGFAQSFPNSINQLMILSANPGICNPLEREKRFQRDLFWSRQLEKLSFDQFMRAWYSQPLFQSFRESPNFFTLCKNRKKQDPNAMKKALLNLSIAKQPSYWASLPKGIYFVGEKDQKYCALYANRKKQIISKVGHAMHLENPQLVYKNLKLFIPIR